ncbi:MAG: hypothetical protein PHY43_11490 [Verrucomicrobiales bacterium]|nr:hypothetical protein [Verrucomicrobiales bacterium]
MNITVPQVGHLPLMALRPFFMVSSRPSTISFLALHLTQYPSAINFFTAQRFMRRTVKPAYRTPCAKATWKRTPGKPAGLGRIATVKCANDTRSFPSAMFAYLAVSCFLKKSIANASAGKKLNSNGSTQPVF